ncbi:MAG: hypothetical protein HQK56_04885 [Deltaproteobacteria bacterium]|nr:hypothetical protein [Deltaproteobacteria bacterium]
MNKLIIRLVTVLLMVFFGGAMSVVAGEKAAGPVITMKSNKQVYTPGSGLAVLVSVANDTQAVVVDCYVVLVIPGNSWFCLTSQGLIPVNPNRLDTFLPLVNGLQLSAGYQLNDFPLLAYNFPVDGKTYEGFYTVLTAFTKPGQKVLDGIPGSVTFTYTSELPPPPPGDEKPFDPASGTQD